jgi:hypothetical protein
MGNLAEVLGLMVGSISTLNGLTPNAFESIKTFNNLDVETKTTWEVLKAQLTLNQQAWVHHHMLFFLGHFLMVNDANKHDLVML